MEERQRRHPGHSYIARYGMLQSSDDVLRYADYLRQEANITDAPPVDLQQILDRFGMPAPLFAPLLDQQAMLLDQETGLVLINEDDPETRQRFSQAHELIELLFVAHEECLVSGHRGIHFRDRKKEDLCEQGAASLLLPRSSFLPQVSQQGVSLITASRLAGLYQTSFLATLFQMVRYGGGMHALVVWRYALKPQQIRMLPSPQQMRLLDADLIPEPQKELRVWWATRTEGLPNSTCIPKHVSVSRESLIFQAYKINSQFIGRESIHLGRVKGTCLVEAKCIRIQDEHCVICLIHLPGDAQ